MSRRSRIAHFRTPFIISVAAPAAFGVACGGKAEIADAIGGAGSSSVSNGGSSAGGSAGSSTGGSAGSPSCSGPAPAGAGYCGTVCVNGQWVSEVAGCNPPPPPITVCPSVEPEVDASCAGYAGNLRCEYEFCGGVLPTRICNSSTGRWAELAPGICNPPAPLPACPLNMPAAGSDCTLEAQECRYDGCQGPASSVAICSFGQWTTAYSSSANCNPPAIQPVCPRRELSAGEGCAFEGQTCSNEPCTSSSRNGFVCDAGAWGATVLSCLVDAGINLPDL
jgi:hypothetical protein